MAKMIKANTEYNSVDTTAGDDSFTCTAVVGKTYEVKNIGSGGFTLTVNYGTESADLEDGQCARFTYDGVGWCVFDINSTNNAVTALYTRVTANEGDIDNLEGSVVTMSATMSYTITADTYRIAIDASTVSASGQVLTLNEGASITRLNMLQVFNGSSEAITVEDGNDSGNTFTVEADSYSHYFFQDSVLEQEVSAGDSGGDGAVVGDVKWTLSDIETNGWKNARYQLLSQTTYAELFGIIGHLYAKDSTDAGTAEGVGEFYLPDGQYLFPRAAGISVPISDSSIDISTDQITVTGHGLETDGSMNGRPVKLLRVAGQTPTMPTGTGYTEYDQNYVRVIDADTLELYDTEAHAIDTSGTTGRVDWTNAGSGTFKLTSMGCYVADQLQGHGTQIDVNTASPSTGNLDYLVAAGVTSSATTSSADSSCNTLVSDGTNGTPRTGNETRPAAVGLGMQIKVIATSISTGEAYDNEVTTIEWTQYADFTDNEITITHNLNAELSSLIVKMFLSNDGGTTYRAVQDYDHNNASFSGYNFRNNDDNSFILEVGAIGVVGIQQGSPYYEIYDDGAYVKFVIYKPSLFAVTKESTIQTVTEAQIVTIEQVEKTIIIPDTITAAFDLTIAAGAGINRTHKINIINESDYIIPVKYSTQTFWVEKQRVQFYLNGSTLVWASAGWEVVFDDDTYATNTLPESELIRNVESGNHYKMVGNALSTNMIIIYDRSSDWRSPNIGSAQSRYWVWDASESMFDDSGFTEPIIKMWLWHNPA